MSLLVFDSGVGGLSVLDAIRRRLPHAGIVYAADNSGFPYGPKDPAEIAARVPALLGRLVERFRPELAVIACNTASTIALPYVRAALSLPVVGTVPAIKPAAERTRTGVIGVLGTQATVRQPYVDRLAAEFAADKTVLRHGAPALVEAAEGKLRGEAVDMRAIRAALDGLRAQPFGDRMDTVVLACTHFPLLVDELRAEAPAVAYVDGAEGIARRVEHLLGRREASGGGLAVFTAESDAIAALRPALVARGLARVQVL